MGHLERDNQGIIYAMEKLLGMVGGKSESVVL
jgi:hypothetical protein